MSVKNKSAGRPMGLNLQIFGPLATGEERVVTELVLHYSERRALALNYLGLSNGNNRQRVKFRFDRLWWELSTIARIRHPKRRRKRCRAMQQRINAAVNWACDLATEEIMACLEGQLGPRKTWDYLNE